MRTTTVHLLTVIAESVLTDRLLRELREAGARGHTISEVRGEGSRGRRVGDVEGANVRIEALVSAAVADRVLERLERDYFAHYALVAWVQDVGVVRGEKYV